MSDIPLHSLRKSRKLRSDYAPLNTDEHNGDDRNSQILMPSAVSKAAVASVSANRKPHNSESRWKGKRRQRYADDPEEQVNLLGDEPDEYPPSDEDREERGSETVSRVCQYSSFLFLDGVLRRTASVDPP